MEECGVELASALPLNFYCHGCPLACCVVLVKHSSCMLAHARVYLALASLCAWVCTGSSVTVQQ